MNLQGGGDLDLSIVVPCYNESLNLNKFYQELLKELLRIKTQIKEDLSYELIFVNDGSKDGSLKILKGLKKQDLCIKIINFSRNFGKEAAILAGLKQSKAKACILIDADLQDPIELIYTMYESFFYKKADIIYARRVNRDKEGKIRAFFSKTFYLIYNLLSEVKLQSGVRDFRLMSKEVVQAILKLNEYHRFCKAIFEWVGFKKICLDYTYRPREAGESGWSFYKLLKYGFEGIISFSTFPLKISFVLGLLTSLLAFFYALYIFFDTLIFGNEVKGYASLICVILFFAGVQLIILGIIGEYIARIYEQVKNRPHFIIKEDNEK
ncbi:glycosyltransferase [Campylobacter sp. MIT 99-7217]|uniref:glycosyltransferase family 2 protein n=1 Tax=Campylobacter sp. MIT 99-7217 TaxID=535091 RepID=UPI001157A33B|nr:glycosyltransferase family 2 protein [Campylobacter sp. MIT 99-7217]TQR29530.1 glycosyltransferase [Campylobacter sp. MIT 99-7217]